MNRAIHLSALLLLAASTARGEVPSPGMPTFEHDVRPIFREHCFDCHGASEEKSGGLDLRLARLLLQGGDSGPAIVAGQPAESYLIERVRSHEMPPGEANLTDAQIATLERWVVSGARTARPEPETIGPGIGISPEERAFWSFQPIHRPTVPSYEPDGGVRTAIDAFLWRAMQSHGLTFSTDADRRTLMLRAYFDLVGLPPTDEQAARFFSDDSPDAYENLIDELLESPHYGERWARHWLDIAGYADSEGANNVDAPRGWAWKYRDYVIQSLNDDKPFDQFIVEQLSGDELAGPREGDLTPRQIELLTATGLLRMAADGTGSGGDSPEGRNQVIADTIKIVSTSLLGLSVACAQCHDHRYDPILQTDYYGLRAVFEPALDWQNWKTPAQRLVSLYTDDERTRAAQLEAEAQAVGAEKAEKQAAFITAALEKELEKFDDTLREQLRTAYRTPGDQRTPEQVALLKQYPSVNISPGNLYQYNQAAADELKSYDARMNEIRGKKPLEEFLRVVIEPNDHSPITHLFHRGDHRQPTTPIPPAALTVCCPENSVTRFADDNPDMPSTGRRLAFARWLTSGQHPLVARVIVNRVWQHHFGRGIVDTPADFGRLGGRPTHPELLDWLAADFVAGGWSLKQLHKRIMMSMAYRQSSYRRAEADAIDPDNRFYWRKSVVRLEAEALRDRMLAATGQLDRALFGPPANVAEDDTGQVIVDAGSRRRSLYIRQRRSQPVALLQAFDSPVMTTNCERRTSSTVAPQSLMLMNGSFVLQQAQQLAARTSAALDGESSDSEQWENLQEPPPPGLMQRVSRAWQLAYCREISTEESELAAGFLHDQLATISSGSVALPEGMSPLDQAMTNLCQALLTSNEFLYVD